MKKRLLALLLCLVMVIGLVPFALAAEAEEYDMMQIHFAANVNEDHGPFYSATARHGDFAKASDLDRIPTPTKEGYTFKGWSSVDGDSTKIIKFDGNSYFYPLQPDLTLYGIWEADSAPAGKHTITYRYNESSTMTIPVNVEDGVAHKVIAYPDTWEAPEKMVFDHWTDGTKTYAPNDIIVAVHSNMTLWADYVDAHDVLWTVTYDKAPNKTAATFQIADWQNVVLNLNGGSYVDANDAANNGKSGEFVLPITKDTTIGSAKADGKTFIGWEKGQYQGGDVVQLTAQWKEDTTTEHIVTFYCWYHETKNETIKLDHNTKIIIDPNGGQFKYGGSYTTKKQSFYLTSNYTIANAERWGYTFYGWEATNTGVDEVTFTARWSKDYPNNTYSIYYYDYDDCKSEYANFPYGTSVVIDPNGGTAKLSGTSFSTKQSFNIYRDYTLTDASRSGYTFYGWDLTKSGSTYYFTAMWSRYKSDVPYMLNGTDHYAYIKGYPNGSFKPTDTITRAEAATIFYRLLTDSTRKAYATTYNSFKDVPATAWYNTAVSTMAKLGIVNGGADGYFRPNDPITRAEIAAMIARCDGAYYTGTSTVFSDTYGHWAASYIARAYELGWINGYGTTYAPDRYISRAETVAVLNRVLNRAPQYTSDLTRNYTTFSDVATSAWYYLDVEEAANSHTYTRKSNADYETWTKLIADPSWF